MLESGGLLGQGNSSMVPIVVTQSLGILWGNRTKSDLCIIDVQRCQRMGLHNEVSSTLCLRTWELEQEQRYMHRGHVCETG